jgi:DNA end-binding protein Ku
VRTEELALAEQLISGLAGHFEPSELRSQYRASLRELLEAKLEGREPEAEAPEPAEAPVVDLMEALRASVAAAKKPRARAAASGTRATPKKRTAAKRK